MTKCRHPIQHLHMLETLNQSQNVPEYCQVTFTQYIHLGELGSSSAGNFGHTELGKFIFQVIQLLEQLFLLLAPQISCLDLGLNHDRRKHVLAFLP